MCRMEFEPGEDRRLLPCSHMYHPPCIAQWLHINKVRRCLAAASTPLQAPGICEGFHVPARQHVVVICLGAQNGEPTHRSGASRMQACPICGKEVTQAQGGAAAQERSSHVLEPRNK